MTPDRYQQLEALYHAASELPPEERAAYLAQACGNDEELRAEVNSLLAAHGEAGSFIAKPAMEVAAASLAQEHVQATAGCSINHYQLLSLLGAGGMGEVHLAQDSRLHRKVALKLLPAQWNKDSERVRRFLKEARAVSALNHPNIITIYEVGEDKDTPYIASEYINGQTLRQMMEQSLPLTQVLDIAIQIASALAAAHEAGIIHRDIKPENVMVRRDGLVKVLDFGLAKPTTPLPKLLEGTNPNSTAPGVILGTLRYMSPEQGRGLRVDARTDIFSFGVLFYELLTGRLPFTGRTSSDVLAALLMAAPPPLPEQYPAELQDIVTKALGKEPDERYQSANLLLAELKQLKQAWERQIEADKDAATPSLRTPVGRGARLTPSAGGGNTNQQNPVNTNSTRELLLSGIRQHRRSVAGTVIVLLLLLGAAGYGVWRLYKLSRQATAFQQMKVTRLTTHGKVDSLLNPISPDGKSVAYVLTEGGQLSVHVLHIPTGSDVQIVPASSMRYDYLAFSPDGNYIFYVGREKGLPPALYRVPIVGGIPAKVLEDINSAVTFAPEGKRFAYLSQDDRKLLIANQDGTSIQTLAVNQDNTKWYQPVWSPDGSVIVCQSWLSNPQGAVVTTISTKGGTPKTLGSQSWFRIAGLAWQRDSSGFLLTAADQETKRIQLWAMSYPDGIARRVTNDLGQYTGISLDASYSRIITARGAYFANLWLVPSNAPQQARQITNETEIRVGLAGLAWLPDQRLVYNHQELGGNQDLWLFNPTTNQKQQLTRNAGDNRYPTVSPDGKTLVFTSTRSGHNAIWRMNLPDGQQTLLAALEGSPVETRYTPDGQWIYFRLSKQGRYTLWKIPSAGGVPVEVSTATNPFYAISPDGSSLASAAYDNTKGITKLALTPLTAEAPTRWLDFPAWAAASVRWMPDGSGLTYVDRRGRGYNLVNLPFAGGPAKPLTDFPSGIIYYFDWSRDGKWLALSHGDSTIDLVMLSDFQF